MLDRVAAHTKSVRECLRPRTRASYLQSSAHLVEDDVVPSARAAVIRFLHTSQIEEASEAD